MAAAAVANLEDQIKTTALTKRRRPTEFFLDYDRLRSGFVTEGQFFRVLWENLGLKFSEEQQRLLSQKYNLKQDGRLNYRVFCNTINEAFNPNDFSTDPALKQFEATELLGTSRTVRPLSTESEQRLKALLLDLNKFYKNRGLNLRTSCEDFDTHHIGVIQESQFYRSFPRPPEVTEEDVALVVQKYRDPDRPGLVNYLNLHHDMLALMQVTMQSRATSVASAAHISDMLPSMPGADVTLQQIFDRIRVAVYKNRVRTIEFFKDYDGLRSGIMTENQFINALSLAIGKEAQLSRPEIQKVAEFYRIPDGRVRYKEFCDMMENAFNIPDLEKKPLQDVIRPPTGALGRNVAASLTEADEQRLGEVIAQLSDQVRRRRLMMYQYFKDYDRSKAYSRVITQTQFGRILHFLTLNVSPEDFKLLCLTFADPTTGDVNYPAFVQVVDQDFVNYTQEAPQEDEDVKTEVKVTSRPLDTSQVNMDDLMARIRHHVLTSRRRVIEFFQDFDPLRSGAITKGQFQRSLSDLGLSALGQHNLTAVQFEALCQYYGHPTVPEKVLWTNFMDDIESVFTQTNLEKKPTTQVPPQEIYRVPKPGTMDWNFASEEHKELLEKVMERIRQRAEQRRVLAKPVFQDFDRHNHGHVTRGQFRQALTMLELNCREDEMQTLEAKFCNDAGFNYAAFLEELQPTVKPKMMYVERLKTLQLANQRGALPESNVATDLEGVLAKIKTKVFKERIRVLEWMKDYDKLGSGRILKNNLRRSLTLCRFELAESELAILEDHYQAGGYPDYVNYVAFSDDIESIFTTNHLEKAPTLDVDKYRPIVDWQENVLEAEQEEVVKQCLGRLTEKVKKNRIQLYPLFEDYDRVHNGMVSKSQFRRVLNELELASLVGTENDWACISQKFDMKVGGRNDINYVAFCDTVYAMAGFELRRP